LIRLVFEVALIAITNFFFVYAFQAFSTSFAGKGATVTLLFTGIKYTAPADIMPNNHLMLAIAPGQQ